MEKDEFLHFNFIYVVSTKPRGRGVHSRERAGEGASVLRLNMYNNVMKRKRSDERCNYNLPTYYSVVNEY